jgi:hypothetical protein
MLATLGKKQPQSGSKKPGSSLSPPFSYSTGDAALTIAMMPALIASGSVGHAAGAVVCLGGVMKRALHQG